MTMQMAALWMFDDENASVTILWVWTFSTVSFVFLIKARKCGKDDFYVDGGGGGDT